MKRYMPLFKARVVRGILAGGSQLLAMAEHDVSAEELDGWISNYKAHGMHGLKSMRRIK